MMNNTSNQRFVIGGNHVHVMNEININVGVIGKIIEGRHKDWYIYVEDDFENTGGYLILTFNDINRLNNSQVYDRWAENKMDLIEMFKSAEWRIDWLLMKEMVRKLRHFIFPQTAKDFL